MLMFLSKISVPRTRASTHLLRIQAFCPWLLMLKQNKELDESAINSALEKVDFAVEDAAAQSIEDV